MNPHTHAAAMPVPCHCSAVQLRTVDTDDNDLFVSFGKSFSSLTAVPAVSSTISIVLTTCWVSGCGSYGSLASVHFEQGQSVGRIVGQLFLGSRVPPWDLSALESQWVELLGTM